MRITRIEKGKWYFATIQRMNRQSGRYERSVITVNSREMLLEKTKASRKYSKGLVINLKPFKSLRMA